MFARVFESLNASLTRLVLLFILFAMFSRISTAQGIRDSVFNIKAVNVQADYIFKKEEAGMKATQVDSLVLMEKISQSLSGLLSENTSVFIKSHGRGALATASFRGTAASHTQVTWNGININSPMTGMVDFSLIPVYIIDDLNLHHGASSIADQSGGLGGSINISNKVNWNKAFQLKYMQGVGSYSTYDEFLLLGFGNKKIQSKTRLYHNYSKNNYSFINHGKVDYIDPVTAKLVHPKDTNDHADYTKYGLLQEIYWRPGTSDVVSAKYWGQYADRTIPRATTYEGPDNSNLNNQQDTDHKFVADWKHYGEKGKLLVQSGYSGKSLDYTLKNMVVGDGLRPAIYSRSKANTFLNRIEYNYSMDPSFKIKTSLDFSYSDVSSRDSVKKTGYSEQQNKISWFGSVAKNYKERLNVVAMLRQDWIDGKAVPFVPFLGFDYRILKETDLLLKGNIARNYHHPSLNDLYWQPGGNPDLKSEEGITYELGLEYQWLGSQHRFKSEITAYRSDIDNWIIWIPSVKGYWEPRNVKNVESTGVEINADLRGNLGELGYNMVASYAYTRSINYGDKAVWGDESYGKQLVYIPLHSANLMMNLNYKRFFITYQWNTYSERFTTSSNDVSRRDWLYPYHMNDVIAGKEIKLKKCSVSVKLKVYNIFNEEYHSILYRPMPGRNYQLMLMFKV